MSKFKDSTFSSKKDIAFFAKKVAGQIEDDFIDSDNPIVLLGVLNGAMPFLNDVMMNISKVPVEIDTIRFKSYYGIFTKGKKKFTKDPELNLSNRTVILVEDIVDTGDTINMITKRLKKRYKGIDIKVCSLFKRHECPTHVDYLGRIVPKDLWLYGYGMDNDELDRNIPIVKSRIV